MASVLAAIAQQRFLDAARRQAVSLRSDREHAEEMRTTRTGSQLLPQLRRERG